MKKIHKLLAVPMTLTILAGLTLPCLAQDYDVTNSQEVVNAVNGHDSSTGDTTVNLILQNNITMENTVNTKAGISYTFQGKEETATPVITDLKIAGEGEVTVNADLTASGYNTCALETSGSTDVTVNGDITAPEDGVKVTADEGDLSLTINGDITAEQNTPIDVVVAGGSSADVTINGKVTGEEGFSISSAGKMTFELNGTIDPDCEGGYIDAYGEGGSVDATINTSVQGNHDGYFLAAYENADHVNLTQNGDLSVAYTPVYIKNVSEAGSVNVNIKGDVTVTSDPEEPERGIIIEGSGPESTVIIDGSMNCTAAVIEGSQTDAKVYCRQQSTVSAPALSKSVSFEAKTLDGAAVTQKSQTKMILVYFDPADEGSCKQLTEAQKRFADQGVSVYGVCMTEDYEAGKKAAEAAGAKFPILKCSDSLKAVYEGMGYTGCQASLMIQNERIIAASKCASNLSPAGSTVTTSLREVPLVNIVEIAE